MNNINRYPDWNTGEVPSVLRDLGVTSIGPAGLVLQFGDPSSGGHTMRLTADERATYGQTPDELAGFLSMSNE